MIEKTRILFVAANPKNTNKLRLDEEIREIQNRIRAADFRDAFDLISRWAVRPDDLLQAFNEVRPHIVHFSVHGCGNSQLIFEDKDGNAKPVAQTALVALFKHVKDNIRLVLLNACHSDAQAQAISKEIECTIGMNQDIGDEAASIFASQFYGALAFGRSVGQAFEQGRTAIMLNGIPEATTPMLLVRPGIDALSVSFISRAPLNPVLPPIALDILKEAVNGNTPVNFIRHTGGIGIIAGSSQFNSNHDLEKAALLEHAVAMLVQLGWLRQQHDGLFFVTHAGYEIARASHGGPREIEQFKQDLARAAATWDVERDSTPVNLVRAKGILRDIGNAAIELAATSSDRKAICETAKMVATDARKLEQHRLYSDGGKSYAEFWKMGNDLLTRASAIVNDGSFGGVA